MCRGAGVPGVVSWGAHVPIVHAIADQSGLLGYIAIDSTVSGRARGGLRLAADLREAEIRSGHRDDPQVRPAGPAPGRRQGWPRGRRRGARVREATPALEFAHAARPLLLDRRYVPDADLGTPAPTSAG